MIRSRVPLLGLTLAIGLAAAPAGLQAGPQETQPLPMMTDAAGHDRGETHTLLAQLRAAEARGQFPHVSTETATAPTGMPAAPTEIGQPGSPFGGLPMMPDPYESVLIVLAAAVAGFIGLWLGHIAGFLRLFRSDEGWPRTRA